MRPTDGGVRKNVHESDRGPDGRAGWRGRLLADPRVRLFLGAAFLFVAALLLLIATTEAGETEPSTTAPPYLTAAGCQGCHNTTYQGWLATQHSQAWAGLQTSPNATAVCEPCHVTGFGMAGGFVNNATTPEMVNVQCEECHGAGTNHAGAPSNQKKVTIVVNYSAEVCGQCHQGEHHPFYSEWSLSGHSQALVNLRGSPAANDTCLQCHAADYILESEPSLRPTIDTAREGITCIVCHDPHSQQYGKQLRMPRSELCASCHNPGATLPGDPIFHPQSSMRAGYSSAPVPADQFMPTVTCDQCHMYAYEDDTRIPPVTTGHSFRQKPEACASCHSVPPFVLSVEESAALIDRWQTETNHLLAEVQYYVAQAEVALDRGPDLGFGNKTVEDAWELYDQANYSKNFVTADGSLGAHNPDYAKNLLLDARQRAQQVIAMLTPGSVTGRVVDADGNPVGGIEVVAGGVTWTVTDADGRFSFQYAQGTHSFDLYHGDALVGEINGVDILPNEESDVGTVRISVSGGGAFYWYLLVLLAAVVAVALGLAFARRLRGRPVQKEPVAPEVPEETKAEAPKPEGAQAVAPESTATEEKKELK